MAQRPITLRLDGEALHLVATRELERWGGFLNGRRSAYTLVTPENVADLRAALMVPRDQSTEAVFVELTKQLEDGSALFFEVPPQPVAWDSPEELNIFKLIPGSGGGDNGGDKPGPDTESHWIEIVCVSPDGAGFAGAKARVRLPDGRSEFVTLDARSSVLFDDLSEGGTAHFELSGDATAHGSGLPSTGTRYDLGRSIGLVTRRQHVLVVHPNPDAFVSVQLFVDDEPVTHGSCTLETSHGPLQGPIEGEPIHVDALVLPSTATYAFEDVILPPRPSEGPDPGGTDPTGPDPGGTDPGTTDPTEPGSGGTDPVLPTGQVQQLRVRLEGGANLSAHVQFDGGSIETTTDADGQLDVDLPPGVLEATLLLPSRGEVYTLSLTDLEPASTPRGASSRLHNLGLFAAPPTDTLTPMLRDAIRTFQQIHALAITGELDSATGQTLEAVHGS